MKHSRVVKWLGVIAQIILGGLALYWLIVFGDIDLKSIFNRFSLSSLWPLLLGSFCFLLAMILGALRYSVFLPASVPFTYTFGVALFQNALLTFVPWRIGEVGYPLLLRRDYKIPVANSIVVIMAIRLMDFTIVTLVALWGAKKLYIDINREYILLAILSLALTAMILIALLRQMNKRLSKILGVVYDALNFLLNLRRFSIFLVISVSVFILTTLQSKFILQATALPLNFADVAILNSFVLIISLLPIHPPGGWGTLDVVQVMILDDLGYFSSTIISSLLAAHSIYSLLILIGGYLGWLILRKRKLASRNG